MFRQIDVFDLRDGSGELSCTYYHYQLISGAYADVFAGDKFVVAVQTNGYNFYVLGNDGVIIDHINKSILFEFIYFYINSMKGSN
jgi:hypothetical protein